MQKAAVKKAASIQFGRLRKKHSDRFKLKEGLTGNVSPIWEVKMTGLKKKKK